MFWKKPTIQHPQFGLLSYSNRQWLSEEIPTTAGNVLISMEGDESGPSPVSLAAAEAVLAEPTAIVDVAMAFVRADTQAREFMDGQGELTLDGFSLLDPGDGCWPFADTVLVVGTISADGLREAVSTLQPDEVGDAERFGISPDIAERHGSPVLAVWWD